MTVHEFAMTDYFAADCPHCQDFNPIWSKASINSHADADWDKVECYGPGWNSGKDLAACKDQRVESFPSVKLLHKTKAGVIDQSWNFHGPRTPEALEDFATQKISEYRNHSTLARSIDSPLFVTAARQLALQRFF